MGKRGEITVFFSLSIVCILSLFMGLLESARTVGARCYLQLAADSATASVMSHYNKNLWELYHLLFLECESDIAIKESFSSYLDFYLEQENLYPLKCKSVEVMEMETMTKNGGVALEKEIFAYMKYRLPDAAENMASLSLEAKEAAKAGDFTKLFEVCRDTGKKTRQMEKKRERLEDCLRDMAELLEDAQTAAEEERESKCKRYMRKLQDEMEAFSGYVNQYEKEVQNFSADVERKLTSAETTARDTDIPGTEITDTGASEYANQHQLAEIQVRDAAKEQLAQYQEMEMVLEHSMEMLDDAIVCLEQELEEDNDAPDWEAIQDLLDLAEIPAPLHTGIKDQEKENAFERLEDVLSGNLLSLVLPSGTVISGNQVSQSGSLPNADIIYENGTDAEKLGVLEQVLINEYCLLSFDSFLESNHNLLKDGEQPLLYEQEYVLCGNKSDNKNLESAIEKILAVRAAMNLLYLLSSPAKKTEADGMAAAISGGNVPVQLVLSFFILSMWALGEAVCDVKVLMKGGSVPFWKTDISWRLSLTNLLSLSFTEEIAKTENEGSQYQDYIRVLYFLMDREIRNERIMDLIQWNVKVRQPDFLIADCVRQMKLQANVNSHHIFLVKNEYLMQVTTVGAY